MTNVRNNVQLIGHLGIDPEVKHLESGKVVANLRMATSDYYKNKDGERVQTTQWHGCVAYYYH